MIIHKLIAHHAKHGPDTGFFLLQARDAIRWLEESGVVFNERLSVLDLGCGSGLFGGELLPRGCRVTFADDADWLKPEIPRDRFLCFNVEEDDFRKLGQYDLVICSNVLEHLRAPNRFLASVGKLLKPGGRFYLSWTNWLSPWGGHDFSPFHYFGYRYGHRLYDKIVRRPRILKPGESLFPTYIGRTLRFIRRQPELRIARLAPRYYTELAFIMRLPILREFLAWNCVLLIERTGAEPSLVSPT
jgi:SAM-dependent methyltransferase